MNITVIYAEPYRYLSAHIHVSAGTTVQAAIELSGLLQQLPTLNTHHVGIFGKEVTPDTCVEDGDRIEIYRPLAMDPKRARREKASAKRFLKMLPTK